MLVAFSRFFLCGEAAVHGFARGMAGNAARGPRCMGSAWRLGPYRWLFCRFSCFAALFRAFPVTLRRPEGPHSRVFCQPGKKTLQRGPLVAFSAAELLFAWVDLARVLSVGPLAHPGPRADWRLCWSRVRGCLSLRASLLIRFAFRLIRLANLLNARSV